jgi:hypothetical protein
VKALLVANEFLEAEVAKLRAKVSIGYSPDPTARAYLTVIDRERQAVEKALTHEPEAA